MATKTFKKAEDSIIPLQTVPTPILSTKMLKMVEDPCFGKKYEQENQCGCCWIKQSCHVAYRNRK